MTDDGAFVLALLLAGLAGWVDAAGLAKAGELFLSFMSGNTTSLAVALTHQAWMKAAAIGAVLVLFVSGVAVGELVEPLAGRYGQMVVLWIESLFLAGAAALGLHVGDIVALYPAVFAMGLQNATMHRAGGINIGLTYVTGTLVQVGRSIAGVARGERQWRRIGEYLALWFSLATGAFLGALAVSFSSFFAMAGATVIAASLGALAFPARS